MPVYVIDSHALLALPALCKTADRQHLFFDGLTDKVTDGSLSFPNLVLQDCNRYASGDLIHTWAKAVASARRWSSVPNMWQEDVLGICPDLLDLDDENEQSPVLVAAMGAMLVGSGAELIIATEDRFLVPNRKCLFEACKDLGFATVTGREMLVDLGLGDFL